ncbi:MAG: CRISPR-associated endonuclease Cas2 [Solirubrobacteraceae bacterium]
MSEPVRRLLIAYDITNDARRDRVAVTLQRYGERVQYSVFVVDGRPAQFVRLRLTLSKLIDPNADRILFCDLGPREAARRTMTHLGQPPLLTGDAPALII